MFYRSAKPRDPQKKTRRIRCRSDTAYDWTEEDFAYLRIAEKLYDDEYVTLNTRLESITTEYWNAQTDTTVEYKGVKYTRDELEELNIDSSTYYSLLNDYYRNLNAVTGQLYLELVGIEKRIADEVPKGRAAATPCLASAT